MSRRLAVFVAACSLVVGMPWGTAAAQPLSCRGYVFDPAAPEPVRPDPEPDCQCSSDGITLVAVDFGPGGEIYVSLLLHCLRPR